MAVKGGGGTFDGGGASGDWDSTPLPKIVDAAKVAKSTFGTQTPFNKLTANDTTKQVSTSSVAATPSAAQLKDIANVNVTGVRAHKIRLTEVGTDNRVVFEVMPEVQETHTSEYEPIAPTQFPGAFQKYKGSSSTQWTINATLISRTSIEATENYKRLVRLRGWMEPFFGQKTGQSFMQKLGAPPPVLMLEGLRDLIGPVPVVITSLTWTWPKDVDYIATTIPSEADGNYVPFPTILNLPITLVESYSIDQFNNFSLEDYRNGNMRAAFNKIDDQTVAAVKP
ncbi:hypothetical protein [Acinetobacter sp.]|uniref:hypothetical protein n=1 Tax=Acinetobacter sp. TaxID=472 RepID=UPI00388D9086